MSDYISRQAAIDAAMISPQEWDGMFIQDLNCRLRDALNDLPSAEVEPVKRGKWTWKDDRDTYGLDAVFWYECSNCNGIAYYKCPYCPNCGAKMFSETEEGEDAERGTFSK